MLDQNISESEFEAIDNFHKTQDIEINITRNQETAFGVSLQSYFGVGKRQPFPPFILM